jgi:hypothetical protein
MNKGEKAGRAGSGQDRPDLGRIGPKLRRPARLRPKGYGGSLAARLDEDRRARAVVIGVGCMHERSSTWARVSWGRRLPSSPGSVVGWNRSSRGWRWWRWSQTVHAGANVGSRTPSTCRCLRPRRHRLCFLLHEINGVWGLGDASKLVGQRERAEGQWGWLQPLPASAMI